ncbi:MAG: hypothetical protein ABTQ73_04745 [Caldilineales bacterium]
MRLVFVAWFLIVFLMAGCQTPPPAPQPSPTLDVAALAPTPVMATPIPAPGLSVTQQQVAWQELDPPDSLSAGELALAGRSVESAATPLDAAALLNPPQAAVFDLAACAMLYSCVRDEAALLAAPPPGVVRTAGALRITHSNGATTVLRDLNGENDTWVSYHYLGYVPAIAQHVLEVRYYEHVDYLMLAAADGAPVSMWALPLPSPDGTRLVSARPLPYSTPVDMPVVEWQVVDGHLSRRHELVIHWRETGIAEARVQAEWLNDSSLQLRAVDQQGALLDTVGTITVRFTATGPLAYLDDKLIYRQVVSPQAIMAENVITSTQGIEFSERLVYDVREAWPREKVYQDRDYRFRELPASVLGANYFLFSNSTMEQTRERHLHFRLLIPATLYVAIDAQAVALPGWMADWQRLDEQVLTDDIPLQLYRKDFPAGEVVLGGNWASPASGIRSHYLLFIP